MSIPMRVRRACGARCNAQRPRAAPRPGCPAARGRPRSSTLPVRWVHISELLDPTPWLSGGELLLTTGMQLEGPEQAREFVTGSPTTTSRGSASGPGSGTTSCPRRCSRRPPSATSRCSRFPTSCRSSLSPRRRSRRLVNEQYAVLRRALAALRNASSGSSSPSAGSSRSSARWPRSWGRRCWCSTRAGSSCPARLPSGDRPRRSSTRCAPRCESGPAAARRGPSFPRYRRATGGSRSRSPPTARLRTEPRWRGCPRPGWWRSRTPARCLTSTGSRSTRR